MGMDGFVGYSHAAMPKLQRLSVLIPENLVMLKTELGRGIRNRIALGFESSAQGATGQYSLSSTNSVPHIEQARLPGVVATVCCLVRECCSVWSVMPHEKLIRRQASPIPHYPGAGFCAGEAILLRL
jgi:hypothetical protein